MSLVLNSSPAIIEEAPLVVDRLLGDVAHGELGILVGALTVYHWSVLLCTLLFVAMLSQAVHQAAKHRSMAFVLVAASAAAGALSGWWSPFAVELQRTGQMPVQALWVNLGCVLAALASAALNIQLYSGPKRLIGSASPWVWVQCLVGLVGLFSIGTTALWATFACVTSVLLGLVARVRWLESKKMAPEKVLLAELSALSMSGVLWVSEAMLDQPVTAELRLGLAVASSVCWMLWGAMFAHQLDRLQELVRVRRMREDLAVALELKSLRAKGKALAVQNRVELALERQSQFLATMSHELRTPLSAVVGLSRMIAASNEYEDSLSRDMGTIERLAVQLLRTVDDGLAFVRGESPVSESSMQEVRMRYLVRDVRVMSKWLAEQQGNRFYMMKSEALPTRLFFDEQRMRQILVNLVSNAARYCNDGEIAISVSARETKGQWMLIWLVEDTGRGMDDEELERFFAPFAKSRDSQGLGLGLPLVRKLVHELRGELKVKSEKGNGTRLRVQIPVERHQSQDSGPMDVEPDHPGKDEGPVSAPMALLPHDDLARLDLKRLRSFIKLGQISEIEHWIEMSKLEESLCMESKRLLVKVERAMRQMDLRGVDELLDQVDTPVSFL